MSRKEKAILEIDSKSKKGGLFRKKLIAPNAYVQKIRGHEPKEEKYGPKKADIQVAPRDLRVPLKFRTSDGLLYGYCAIEYEVGDPSRTLEIGKWNVKVGEMEKQLQYKIRLKMSASARKRTNKQILEDETFASLIREKMSPLFARYGLKIRECDVDWPIEQVPTENEIKQMVRDMYGSFKESVDKQFESFGKEYKGTLNDALKPYAEQVRGLEAGISGIGSQYEGLKKELGGELEEIKKLHTLTGQIEAVKASQVSGIESFKTKVSEIETRLNEFKDTVIKLYQNVDESKKPALESIKSECERVEAEIAKVKTAEPDMKTIDEECYWQALLNTGTRDAGECVALNSKCATDPEFWNSVYTQHFALCHLRADKNPDKEKKLPDYVSEAEFKDIVTKTYERRMNGGLPKYGNGTDLKAELEALEENFKRAAVTPTYVKAKESEGERVAC